MAEEIGSLLNRRLGSVNGQMKLAIPIPDEASPCEVSCIQTYNTNAQQLLNHIADHPQKGFMSNLCKVMQDLATCGNVCDQRDGANEHLRLKNEKDLSQGELESLQTLKVLCGDKLDLGRLTPAPTPTVIGKPTPLLLHNEVNPGNDPLHVDGFQRVVSIAGIVGLLVVMTVFLRLFILGLKKSIGYMMVRQEDGDEEEKGTLKSSN